MPRKTSIAIIGGGFTGAAISYHLTRGLPVGAAGITVFEPRDILGAGLAYDTAEPVHRINVPASRMSLLPEDSGHFVRWLSTDSQSHADTEAHLPDGRVFPRRNAFGRYVNAHIQPLIASGAVEHVRGRVTGVRREGERWRVETKDTAIDADLVVIATSHPPPVAPAGLSRLAGDPRLVTDPLAAGAVAGIGKTDRVLIVGTGLTMADIVAALDRRGHTGSVTAISRRGQRSRGHGAWPMQAYGDFVTDPATTTATLVKRIRQAVREAEAQGMTWHAVFDNLRKQGGPIWAALPEEERRRLVRHLRPFWDTHRFRIAPQVESVLQRRIGEGTLELIAASLAGAERTGDTITAAIRPRGTQTTLSREFDTVVVTTGPSHGTLLRKEPYLAELFAAGFVRGDRANLGIACDQGARAIGADGTAEPSLFIAGPLARGTFGELMGLPEVSAYAGFVAERVAGAVTARTPARALNPGQ